MMGLGLGMGMGRGLGLLRDIDLFFIHPCGVHIDVSSSIVTI